MRFAPVLGLALVLSLGSAPAPAQLFNFGTTQPKPKPKAKPKPKTPAAHTAPGTDASAQAAPAPAARKPKPAAPAAAATTTPKPNVAATPRQPAAPRAATPAAPAAPKGPLAASYAALPLAERIAIQYELIWAGDYNGVANGEFNDRAIAAVKAFQKRNRTKETGILNPQERAQLAAAARPAQEQVGWRMVDDAATGIRLGIPGKIVTQAAAAKAGSRWFSNHEEVQVETFRVLGPQVTLPAVFEQQKKEPPERRVEYNVLRPDFFVISGLQGLKKFYVRAQVRDHEVRGVTILYDQAMEGQMEPAVIAMSSAFTPFAFAGPPPVIAPPPKRKVEYATGIVVNPQGYIVSDREATDACQVIVMPGYGNADRIAEDKASGLALLRLYGVRDLASVVLATPAPAGGDLALIGIADPQGQAGGGAASTVPARLAGDGRVLEQPPALGFAGAAATDRTGHLIGMVEVKPQVVAGPSIGPQASVVPLATIRKFLDDNKVPITSPSGSGDPKSALVRVICVRK